MSRETRTADEMLVDDLTLLAEEERVQLGDPPRAEELIALIEGRLPDDAAEDLRDRLVVDPEWMAIYLDLKRTLQSPESQVDEIPESEIDEAWRAVSAKLDREAGQADDGRAKVLAFRRPGSGRTLLALAAAMFLALGLIWLLAGRDGPASLPDGEYHVVEVTGAVYRDARLPIPADVVGLELRIDARNISGAVVVQVSDASGRVVRREETTVEDGQREIVFRVASRSLEDGRTYRLAVHPKEASPDQGALIETVFSPRFEN